MTRDEAIEILKEIIDEGWLISDFEKCTAIDACEMAIEALEQETVSKEVYDHEYFLRKEFELKIDKLQRQLEALEQEPRWIPVSERLPKAYEFVNCTCHSLIDDREDWVIETCYLPQPHNSPYSDWGNIPMLNWGEAEVIAWIHRDIPKPYKAESEDK